MGGVGAGGGGLSELFDKLTKNPNLKKWAGWGHCGRGGGSELTRTNVSKALLFFKENTCARLF